MLLDWHLAIFLFLGMGGASVDIGFSGSDNIEGSVGAGFAFDSDNGILGTSTLAAKLEETTRFYSHTGHSSFENGDSKEVEISYSANGNFEPGGLSGSTGADAVVEGEVRAIADTILVTVHAGARLNTDGQQEYSFGVGTWIRESYKPADAGY